MTAHALNCPFEFIVGHANILQCVTAICFLFHASKLFNINRAILVVSTNLPSLGSTLSYFKSSQINHALGHSGDFDNAAKMVGKMSKSVMQLISIRF